MFSIKLGWWHFSTISAVRQRIGRSEGAIGFIKKSHSSISQINELRANPRIASSHCGFAAIRSLDAKYWSLMRRKNEILTVIRCDMFGFGGSDTTKLQDCILNKYDMMIRNPKQIAAQCDCSESYVKKTLDEYRSGWDNGGFSIL